MSMNYRALTIERSGPVATVRMLPVQTSFNLSPPAELHQEMGHAMSTLRNEDDIRLVILTGAEDGEFVVPPPTSQFRAGGHSGRLDNTHAEWARGTGVIRAHQAMAEMEKPVIAQVNGDAMGFGSSLMFNCDLIVAREDAKICDMHLGLGTVMPSGGSEPVGAHFSMYPGDGGLSLVPLFMSPARAKEYLFLAKEYSAREMADLGWINRAVPMAELETVTRDFTDRLLQRAPDIIAYTKRVANRHVVQQLNFTLDAATAYEHLSIRDWLAHG
jgi:enoyl-CoA hydratase/carnithine racemase